MFKSLDELAEMNELSFMDDMVSGMLEDQAKNESSNKEVTVIRKEKIKRVIDEAELKYGRPMTPASKLSMSSKTTNLENHQPLPEKSVARGKSII